jgi:acyl carrier protein
MDTFQDQLKYNILLLIRRYLNKSIVSIDSSDDLINNLGLLPIDIIYLVTKIENEFHVFIYDEDITRIRTVSDIVNIVFEKKNLMSTLVFGGL